MNDLRTATPVGPLRRGSELAKSENGFTARALKRSRSRTSLPRPSGGTPHERITRGAVPLTLAPAVRMWRDTPRAAAASYPRGPPVEHMSTRRGARVLGSASTLAHRCRRTSRRAAHGRSGCRRRSHRSLAPGSTRRAPSRTFIPTGRDRTARSRTASAAARAACQLGHRVQRDPAPAASPAAILFRDFYWHYFEPQMGSPTFCPPDLCSAAAD